MPFSFHPWALGSQIISSKVLRRCKAAGLSRRTFGECRPLGRISTWSAIAIAIADCCDGVWTVHSSSPRPSRVSLLAFYYLGSFFHEFSFVASLFVASLGEFLSFQSGFRFAIPILALCQISRSSPTSIQHHLFHPFLLSSVTTRPRTLTITYM